MPPDEWELACVLTIWGEACSRNYCHNRPELACHAEHDLHFEELVERYAGWHPGRD